MARKKRKKLPRLYVWRGHKGKKPSLSATLKARWADPVWREQHIAKLKAGAAKRTDGRRLGLPDGMRRTEADKLNKEAAESTKETMTKLKAAGVLDGVDERGEAALATAVEIMRSPGDKKVTLAAARLVLEFTKSKPAAKSDITVNKAEEWLAAVTATNDSGSDEGEASKDA